MDTIADASPGEDHIPQEVRDTLSGLAFAAGGANVVMQLSRLPVGRGVALSKVDSGRVDRHPLKRLDDLGLLVIALLGTEEERLAIRGETNRAHTAVRSEPTDPVQYNAFDPELQLWVAACLYKGTENIYTLYRGTPDPASIDEVLYPHCKRLGTTLQVTERPADRAAFEEYWNAGIAKIEMDDLTRGYLQGVANLSSSSRRRGSSALRCGRSCARSGAS